METPKKYDLSGVGGAETFRDLPEGLRIKLTNGAIAEIIGNPRDGGNLMVRMLEHPDDPSMVGEEEIVFFTNVAEVL